MITHKHTPVPWVWGKGVGIYAPYSPEHEGSLVASTGNLDLNRPDPFPAGECEANAALIVKAVNCHAVLVEALTNTLQWFEARNIIGGTAPALQQSIRAALKQAE